MDDTMPILIPEGGRSAARQSRVASMMVASTGCDANTPRVDWTVSAVMHAVPKSECAAKTIRSAVTPAPDEGSNPAMVRTVCIGVTKKTREIWHFLEEIWPDLGD